jgi:hypothetical protein
MRVNVVGELWTAWAKAQRKRQRELPDAVGSAERKEAWVLRNAPGKSFAEFGGLLGHAGAIAFAAEEAGATSVTEFDGGDPDLCGFADEHRRRDSKVRFVQGDLDDVASVGEVGVHDLVYCTGVIYHSPNPVRQLMNLREVTGELLYVGSLTIPEIPGFPNACIYYPYLSTGDRHPYKRGYSGGTGELTGVTTPFNDRPMTGHANGWWGITPSAMRSMLRTARFEVIAEVPTPKGAYLTELVARPVTEFPIMPPLGYYRERQRRRENDNVRLPFRDYYEARAFADHDVHYGLDRRTTHAD